MVIHHANCKIDKCIYQEALLTAVSAITCRRMKILVMKKNHLGSKSLVSPMKLERTEAPDSLPNAQYPDMATLK